MHLSKLEKLDQKNREFIQKKETLEIIDKLNIPNIYVCDSFIASKNSYNYLD